MAPQAGRMCLSWGGFVLPPDLSPAGPNTANAQHMSPAVGELPSPHLTATQILVASPVPWLMPEMFGCPERSSQPLGCGCSPRMGRVHLMVPLPHHSLDQGGPPTPSLSRREVDCVSVHQQTVNWLCERQGIMGRLTIKAIF